MQGVPLMFNVFIIIQGVSLMFNVFIIIQGVPAESYSGASMFCIRSGWNQNIWIFDILPLTYLTPNIKK